MHCVSDSWATKLSRLSSHEDIEVTAQTVSTSSIIITCPPRQHSEALSEHSRPAWRKHSQNRPPRKQIARGTGPAACLARQRFFRIVAPRCAQATIEALFELRNGHNDGEAALGLS